MQLNRKNLKTICCLFTILLSGLIQAENSPIFLSWNKVGCQSDNTNKINLTEEESHLSCLQVCKNSYVTYWLSTEDIKNIESIQWTITNGFTDVTNEFSTSIKWGDYTEGLIKIKIIYKDESIWIKELNVCLTEPTLLLSWESLDCLGGDNNIAEIRFDENASNTDALLVCEKSGFIYKISGSDVSNISSILWHITGGSAESPKSLTCPIKWESTPDGTLRLQIGFKDGSSLDQTINIVKKPKGGGNVDMAPNSIRFNFDTEGNQVKREVIYLAKVRDPNSVNSNSWSTLKKDSLYDDISYYPNPVKQELFIKWKNPNTGNVKSIELYSLSGQLMKIFKNLQDVNDKTIDFNNYPSGMYNLLLTYTNAETKTLKILKE